MSWKDWICLFAVILGVILFLYGANYYNAAVGWLGVLLIVGGIVTLLLLYVYTLLAQPSPQNPP
ncbi:MAG: hypothetical protein NWF05_09255 [Candidatus Bathyarchaeota archaeon]|nr:hypothetical protein [Candidatus Bathyarchaeota archaeon]